MLKIINWFAHPRLVFWLLPLMMLLLVVGTIAQREIGLYEAERLYFSGFAMYSLLALLSLGLLAKLILKSPYSLEKSGSILTHLGVLLLMLGGLLTAISAEEGHLSAAEGETSNVVSDYHARELALLDADGKAVWSWPHEDLRAGEVLSPEGGGFSVAIEKSCRNCLPAYRDEVQETDRGVAAQVTLNALALEKKDEANLAGVQLRISGAGEEQNGRYVLFEPMKNRPVLTIGGEDYTLAVRKKQRKLPFRITLLEFEKFTYAGSDTAKEYQSKVQIDEGDGLVWQAMIRMNEPLRIMGYTLYQSSFLEQGDKQVSVLAVVKNKGRVFPYVASLVIGLGLLWHLRVRRKK